MKELQLELRFNTMLLQAYKSLEACKCIKHYQNVYNGWVKRLESEFPLDGNRFLSVETFKLIWRCTLEQYADRVITGDKIIQTAFE